MFFRGFNGPTNFVCQDDRNDRDRRDDRDRDRRSPIVNLFGILGLGFRV